MQMERREFVAALMASTLLGVSPGFAADPNKIKVGILVPLTGPFAAVAETQKNGALLAVVAILFEHHGGVVVEARRTPLEERGHDHHSQLAGQAGGAEAAGEASQVFADQAIPEGSREPLRRAKHSGLLRPPGCHDKRVYVGARSR